MQDDKTRILLWHKAYEDDMTMTSSSDFVPSRVIADLSVYHKNEHHILPDHGIPQCRRTVQTLKQRSVRTASL